MAAAWLLQALYSSLLAGADFRGGSGNNLTSFDLLANTTSGTVQGFADVSGSVTVVKFYGVPFAKAPIGALRFQPPVAPDPWNGTRPATKFGPECTQVRSSGALKNGQYPGQNEDCLFLNVYTPIGPGVPNPPLAVMVWIHGGSLTGGAGSRYDATNLARKGVVMVTINYRLDALGFLSTADDIMPGNLGNLDQIAALKWVKENIAAFGGDPGRVTVFGESSGSTSVSLLTLSPLAKGLFQSAIMESGVSLNPWAIQHPATRLSPRISVRLISGAVGCTEYWDSKKLLECLQKVDAELLVNQSSHIRNQLDSWDLLSTRVETTYGFLPDLPIRLLDQMSDMPINTLRGYNTDEAGGSVAWRVKNKNVTVDDFRRIAFQGLQNFAIVDVDDFIKTMESIYIETDADSDVIKRAILEAKDDIDFVGGTLMELNKIKSKSVSSKKHYLYEFNQRSTGYNNLPSWMSASHFEEVAYVFGLNLEGFKAYGYTPTKDEFKVSEMMMDMWTSFAKSGVPTSSLLPNGVAWTEYQAGNPQALKIQAVPAMVSASRPKMLEMYKTFLKKIDTSMDASDIVVG